MHVYGRRYPGDRDDERFAVVTGRDLRDRVHVARGAVRAHETVLEVELARLRDRAMPFAHELVARFPQHFRCKRGIVPHLFNSAETTAQAGVFGQVDVSNPPWPITFSIR